MEQQVTDKLQHPLPSGWWLSDGRATLLLGSKCELHDEKPRPGNGAVLCIFKSIYGPSRFLVHHALLGYHDIPGSLTAYQACKMAERMLYEVLTQLRNELLERDV